MTIDIYIREKNGDREIRIPILPEQIQFSRGEATFVTSDIMGLGEVAVPSGTDLANYSWSSEFPGERRRDDAIIRGSWKEPESYHNTLADWLKSGTKLNLLVTGYPINDDVYLTKYGAAAAGAFGDIAYEISFTEARDITIKTSVAETETPKRPATTSSSYTIKSGDTLWGIAKQFYGDGTKWQIIYDANKEIIEQTAKNHGRSSSQNGHWIYPGVTLIIPDASTPAQAREPDYEYEEKREAAIESYVTAIVPEKGVNNNLKQLM